MSNKYSPGGDFIIDEIGRKYALDQWHPMPLPAGIVASKYAYPDGRIVETCIHHPLVTHWLARRPLPPVPRPKTQEEMDGDALNKAAGEYDSVHRWAFTKGWDAGIAHARKEGK